MDGVSIARSWELWVPRGGAPCFGPLGIGVGGDFEGGAWEHWAALGWGFGVVSGLWSLMRGHGVAPIWGFNAQNF